MLITIALAAAALGLVLLAGLIALLARRPRTVRCEDPWFEGMEMTPDGQLRPR